MSTITHSPASSLPRVPEATLVAAAQKGDLGAFEQLVQRYEPRVLRLAIRIVGNEADAEDVMQEAFLKAYSKLGQFQRQSSFYTWVVRIAVNEALMRLRRRRGGKELSLDENLDTGEELLPREIEDWRPNPEQQFAQQELHDLLGSSIAALALPYRVVFQLRDVEGFSTEETADVLRLGIPAVKSRLLRARLQLRDMLSRHFRGPVEGTA